MRPHACRVGTVGQGLQPDPPHIGLQHKMLTMFRGRTFRIRAPVEIREIEDVKNGHARGLDLHVAEFQVWLLRVPIQLRGLLTQGNMKPSATPFDNLTIERNQNVPLIAVDKSKLNNPCIPSYMKNHTKAGHQPQLQICHYRKALISHS
jgi:hypothetical protein